MITENVLVALDLLTAEFAGREQRADADVGVAFDLWETSIWPAWDERGHKAQICGMPVHGVLKELGATLGCGANCHALVFPDTVIKWETRPGESMHDNASPADAENLYKYARSSRKTLLRHLAKPEIYGRFIIQKRIRQASQTLLNLSYDRREQHGKKIIDLALELGLSDLHAENWGFAVDDVDCTTPVIFDFSGTPREPYATMPNALIVLQAVGLAYESTMTWVRPALLDHLVTTYNYEPYLK